MKKTRIALVLILGVLIVSGLACGESDLSLGESTVIMGISVSVVEYKLSESISCQTSDLFETEYPSEGETFLWIYMRAENIVDGASLFMQPIASYEGGTPLYRWLGVCDNIDALRTMYRLEPGETTEGWQIWHFPKGLDISTVRICGVFSSGEKICWKLTQ